MTGIYCYYNKINGKRYIGQAIDLERRKKDHYTRAFNDFPSNTEYNSIIHKAFRKYGYDSFEYSVLEECIVEELNDRETWWIEFYDSYNQGYNCDKGGNKRHFCKFNENVLNDIYYDLLNTNMTYEEIRKRHNVSIGFVCDFNNGKLWKQEDIDYPIRKLQCKKHFCSSCGAELYEKTQTGLCFSCYCISSRKATRPTRKELKYLIRNYSFVEIGKQFGVSDNAIKKWCESYKLPKRKGDIKKYTDSEWEEV